MSKAKTTRLHAQTHNKQWWAFAAGWTQGTSESVVPTAPRQLLHQHTYTGRGGCQYFSHRFICLHSFLSSLVSNYLFLWTDSCFHWHFTYYTHTHTQTWNFYENFLSLCLPSFRVSEGLWIWYPRQMIIHRVLLPEAPAAVKTCAGTIHSIHIGLYNNKLCLKDVHNILPAKLLLYLHVQSCYYTAWRIGYKRKLLAMQSIDVYYLSQWCNCLGPHLWPWCHTVSVLLPSRSW